MELKLYLRILMKRWWLILAAFIFTLIPTFLFVQNQPWIYEATATFVIRPRAAFTANPDEFVKAVDTLSRRVEINTTYAGVADSKLIKDRAINQLALAPDDQKGLKVNSRVIAGTNVLEINGQGYHPEVVRDFTEAVGQQTTVYVSDLYEVFKLEPLDEATVSNKPVGPNKQLNMAIGGILGLLMGIGLVFLLEYLEEPIDDDNGFDVIDPITGAYNRPYFLLRLQQEMSRVRRHNYPVSLAFIKISHQGPTNGSSLTAILRKINIALASNLREEDILSYFGQSTFALLLPDMTGESAKALIKDLRAKTGLLMPREIESDQGVDIYSSVGIVIYPNRHISEEEIIAQAIESLEDAHKSALRDTKLLDYGEPSAVLPLSDHAISGEYTVLAPQESLTRKEIAEKLDVSVSTVRRYEREFQELFLPQDESEAGATKARMYPPADQRVFVAIHFLRQRGIGFKDIDTEQLRKMMKEIQIK